MLTQRQIKKAVVLALALAGLCTPGNAAEPIADQKPRGLYDPPHAPVVPFAFNPLPVGAVRPDGWLKDWAVAAREGITGHLDEFHPVFRDAWKGIKIESQGSYGLGFGWPLEQSAYWFDGALRLGYVLNDQELISKIRARLDPIVDGVNRGGEGTSFWYWLWENNPKAPDIAGPDSNWGLFNGWAHSHMGRAMVGYYRGSGDRRVLDALVKAYVAFPRGNTNSSLGPIYIHETRTTGLCNVEAMLETYGLTGDRRLLDRAVKAMQAPDVVKDLEQWRRGVFHPGHMVTLLENIRLPAVVYPWGGDPRLLDATLCALKWLDDNHMLPYGVPAGEEFGTGVGAFRKTETCNVTALLHTTSWMYRILGERDWGDRMERIFFNAAPGPVARDFKTMSYYQMPNRIDETLPPAATVPHENSTAYSPVSSPLCCVAALSRILPGYISQMWMATADNGLAATLYGPCTVSARAGDGTMVKVITATDYPFRDTLSLNIEPEKAVTFPLYLRIPGWCAKPRILVNKTEEKGKPDDRGFVKIERSWNKGDRVELQLPMTPQLARGFETEYPKFNRGYFAAKPERPAVQAKSAEPAKDGAPAKPAVPARAAVPARPGVPSEAFQPRRMPYMSVYCGPLLFALPIPDKDPNTAETGANWKFALDTDFKQPNHGIKLEFKPMPKKWNWPISSPVVLSVPAQAFDWQPSYVQALPPGPVEGKHAEMIQLIPYGCTKFRVSMFPVTQKALNVIDERNGSRNTKGMNQ
jgi:hypothetical protein